MIELSEGALDAIMAGHTVENPIFQILGHKKLDCSTIGDRYSLFISDGRRINYYTLLDPKFNHMIQTDFTKFTICQINNYAMSNYNINNEGNSKRMIVILSIHVKVFGCNVGRKIGEPTEQIDIPSPTEQAHLNKPETVAAVSSWQTCR